MAPPQPASGVAPGTADPDQSSPGGRARGSPVENHARGSTPRGTDKHHKTSDAFEDGGGGSTDGISG